MKNRSSEYDHLQDLRRQAEAASRHKRIDLDSIRSYTPENIVSILHELHVHQIELEMQNEELRHAQVALQEEKKRYIDLYDLAPVGYISVDATGIVRRSNLTAAKLFDANRRDLVGTALSRFIHPGHQDRYYLFLKEIGATQLPGTCELKVLISNTFIWANFHWAVSHDDGYRVTINDITPRKETERALKEAYDEIKVLRGIIPICMHCKKIRDVQGAWEQVEVYLKARTDAEFSHALCPDCKQQFYPDMDC